MQQGVGLLQQPLQRSSSRARLAGPTTKQQSLVTGPCDQDAGRTVQLLVGICGQARRWGAHGNNHKMLCAAVLHLSGSARVRCALCLAQ